MYNLIKYFLKYKLYENIFVFLAGATAAGKQWIKTVFHQQYRFAFLRSLKYGYILKFTVKHNLICRAFLDDTNIMVPFINSVSG